MNEIIQQEGRMQRLVNFFSSQKNAIQVLSLLVLFLSLPITLLIVQRQQKVRQEAQASNMTYYVDATLGNDAFDGRNPVSGRGKQGPWKTLDKANSTVASGDTVRLKGTFLSQFISPLASGTANKPITYTSYVSETAIVDGGKNGSLVLLDGKSFIVVDRIRLQNSNYVVSGGTNYTGVFLKNSNNNIIRNSSLDHVNIRMRSSSDNIVDGNTITNVVVVKKEIVNGQEVEKKLNGGNAVEMFDGSSRNKIINNKINHAGHMLVSIGNFPNGANSLDNYIAYNQLSNPWATPIGIGPGTVGAIIEHNNISDGATEPVYDISGQQIITPRPGIQIAASGQEGKENIVRFNFFTNNTLSGILLNAYVYQDDLNNLHNYVVEAISNKIYNNVFYKDLGPGIRIAWSRNAADVVAADPAIKNNLIANNIFFKHTGERIYASLPVSVFIQNTGIAKAWPTGSLNGNKILNNIILRGASYAGEKSVVVSDNSQVVNYYSLQQFQSLYPDAQNNLEVDPLFVNESAGDFHLTSQSPAIDKGILISGLSYLGNAPDIGMFEYSIQTTSTPTPFSWRR